MTRLRFALLFDGATLERWHLRCLEALEPDAELTGVVVAPASPTAPSDGEPRLLRRYAERLALRSTVEVGDRFTQLPPILLDPAGRDGEGGLDFVLVLGRVTVPPGLEETARLGVWRFEHEMGGSRLPFLAQVYAGENVTRVALLAADARTGGATVLEEGVFRTEKRSYVASRDRILDAIAAWPARACRRIGSGSLAGLPRAAMNPRPAEIGVGPIRLAATLTARRLRFAWERLFRHPQWNVGVLRRPVESLLEPAAYDDEDIDWFPLHGRSGFLADPFGVERNGRVQILCEHFDYRESTGRVCALEYSADGFSSKPEDALSLPVHTSYPFLLDLPEGVHCVPETADAGEIALFRAIELPGNWVRVAVLVEGFPGVDPTVFRHDGRWWLTCTRKGPQEDAELWVWYAPTPTGPWEQHAVNPVKTDVRGARPAGPPFAHRGALYRPTQDCSGTYGGRITLQRVSRLTPTEFAEEPVAVLEASPRSRFPLGPHTLTPVGDVVLVDGRRTVFVPAALRAFLRIWARDLARRVRRTT